MGRFGINRDSYGFEIPDIYNNAASGYTFSAEYQTVYDSFIVKPAADIAQQQDIMVRALVSAGIWAKLDVFYIFANNTRANAVINWINPGTFDAIEVNAPTFLAYRHFVGNGVNQYLRTQYTPSIDAINYAQNDAHASVYIRNNRSANERELGSEPATNRDISITSRFGDGNAYIKININLSGTVANADSTGFYVLNRVLATHQDFWRNSVRIINDARASNGVPDSEIYLLCYNAGGAAASFSQKQLAAASIGGGIDESGNSEITNYTNAIETYMDYIGAGVI